MQSHSAIIVGGLAPALFWGVTAVFQKLSASAMLGPGRYLSVFGLTIAIGGALYAFLTDEPGFSTRGAMFAFAAGLSFALGTGLLSFVLWRYGTPISRLAPILSANALVPVLVGLFLFGEGADSNRVQLVVGTMLVLGGVVLVIRA